MHDGKNLPINLGKDQIPVGGVASGERQRCATCYLFFYFLSPSRLSRLLNLKDMALLIRPVSPMQCLPLLPLAGLFLICGLALTSGGIAESAGPESMEERGWQEASIFLFQEAHETFSDRRQPASRESALGEAVTFLGLQPRTTRNVQRAQEALQKLIDENPDDSVGLAARFFLARLFEIHLSDPDLSKARELYDSLRLEGAGDPFAEMAASRVAIIDLYQTGGDPESMTLVLESIKDFPENLKTPIGRREFFANVGLTLVDMDGDPGEALQYLLAAAEYSFPLPQVESIVFLAIGQLAEDAGDLATAKDFYSQFVEQFPRDARRYSVERMLEELAVKESEIPPATTEPEGEI